MYGFRWYGRVKVARARRRWDCSVVLVSMAKGSRAGNATERVAFGGYDARTRAGIGNQSL